MSQKENAASAKSGLEKLLIQGYQEMAQINSEMAQMCFDADNEAFVCYEEKLTECE